MMFNSPADDRYYCCRNKYISNEPPVVSVLPDRNFHRFPHEPGGSVLGFCIPSLGTIGLREDLYGTDFEKVMAHERMHDAGINEEYLIRLITDMRYPDSKY